MSETFVKLAVGERHPLLRPPFVEGMSAACGPSGITLIVTLDGLSGTEVRRLRREAPAQFGLVPLPPYGYAWLLRIKGVATLDAPYSPAANPPDKRALRPRTAAERYLVEIHGTDGWGIVNALRHVSISPSFSKIFEDMHSAACAAADSFTPEAWARTVAGFNARFPNPDDAFKAAAIVEMGGLP